MINQLTLFLISLFCAGSLLAQPTVKSMPSKSGEAVAYLGQLEEGTPMPDLSWAWNSSVACFVEPRAEFFRGPHALYRSELPPYSTMVITLIPKDKKQRLSLYAYSGGRGSLPPELASCVSCEADFPDDQPRVKRREIPRHYRQVELRSARNPYPVTIGVSGPAGIDQGDFTIQIDVKRNR